MAPKFLIGRKVGMSQIFTDSGQVVPITVVTAGPCPVVQVKTKETDGYSALQLAFEKRKPRRVRKPQLGHFEKAKVDPHHFLREVRLAEDPQESVGDVLTVGLFSKGDVVDVVGRNKGRGFQGVVRVYNFKAKRETHGNMNQRGPGAIGMHTEPARTLKGKKMPTHWGNERVTVKNLEVVEVDKEHNELWLRGGVPGPPGAFVVVRAAKTGKPRPVKTDEKDAAPEKGPEKGRGGGKPAKGGAGA
ncbi:MAG: 50S ribosomal protein L3 [Planctomycetota bacterium]